MSDNILMLKSLQYLIICKAGLAVCEEIEASTEELRREILREFKNCKFTDLVFRIIQTDFDRFVK